MTPPLLTSIELALQPYGSTGAGLSQRCWKYDVSFSNGGSSVASPASGDLSVPGTRFLYDTGTNVTLIRDTWAATLALMGAADFTMMVEGALLSGYYLDSLTMTGVGGMFTVLGAPVLVTPSALGGSADAIIASNLFWSSRVLFDGPGATLSIEGPVDGVPEPGAFVLVCSGLVALRAWRRRRGQLSCLNDGIRGPPQDRPWPSRCTGANHFNRACPPSRRRRARPASIRGKQPGERTRLDLPCRISPPAHVGDAEQAHGFISAHHRHQVNRVHKNGDRHRS